MSADVIISTPATADQQKVANQLTIRQRALVIDDAESHGAALVWLKDAKTWIKGVRDLLRETIDLANRAHKAATALRSKLITPVQEMYDLVEQDAIAWKRKALAEAERVARQQEEAQREADEAAAIAEAQQLQDDGHETAAEEVIAAQVEAPAPLTPRTPEIAKVSGTHETGRWSAVLKNQQAAIAFVAEHPEFSNAIKWDMVVMNGLARAQREHFKFDGFKAEKKTTMTVTT